MAHRKSNLVDIAIVLPNLRAGGAERVSIYLANAFISRGLRVDMVLMQAEGELQSLLDPRVRVVDLQCGRVRHLFRPLRRYLLDVHPSGLLANMWPLTAMAVAVASLLRLNTRIVAVEHNTWSVHGRGYRASHRVALRSSMRKLMPYADALVGVSGGVARDLEDMAGLPVGRVHTIYNPVTGLPAKQDDPNIDPVFARDWLHSSGKKIIAVGTLKAQKRFDRLLHAFARLPREDVVLLIVGEGTERQALESLASDLGVRPRVFMPGFTRDPAVYLRQADLFVLSSDYEGLPTVLIEALEAGTPVVSTDCPSGPREILDDGKYGTLVPVADVDALARAMEEALSRKHDRDALRRRAQDFSVDKAADAYLDLLLPGWRKGCST
nr:glycosyltransferase [Thermomonas flagellata]